MSALCEVSGEDAQRRAEHAEYEGREQEMQQLMQRLEDYPTKIMQMAGVYDQASQSNEQIAGKLKPNIPLV